jgi:hypothetical protein
MFETGGKKWSAVLRISAERKVEADDRTVQK